MAEKYLFWLFMLVVAIRYQHATINMLSDTFTTFLKHYENLLNTILKEYNYKPFGI
jgi:hypothetical protein